MSFRAIIKRSQNQIEMGLCLDYDDMQFICSEFPAIIKRLRAEFEVQETTFVSKKTTEEQQNELKVTKYHLHLAESLLEKVTTELSLNDDLPF